MSNPSLALAGLREANPGRRRGRNARGSAKTNARGGRRRGRSRRRGRRRNPSKDTNAALRTGIGAAIGSLVGGLLGGGLGFAIAADSIVDQDAITGGTGGPGSSVVFATPGLWWLGSIAGGAIGGAIGAPDDRNRRGAIGGAVGGIMGPIGAGIGGAIGGSKRDGRSDNPTALGTAAAVGVGLAAAGAGYLAFRSYRMMSQPKLPPGAVLADVLSPGATLADSPFVVGDVTQPVQLTTVLGEGVGSYTYVPSLEVLIELDDGTYAPAEVHNASFGIDAGGASDDVALSGRIKSGSVFDQRNELPGGVSDKAIARVVTGIKGTFARDLYERMLSRIVNSDLDFDDPTQRDKAIREVLGKVVPQVDYSRGLETYTFGDAPSRAWAAAQLMGAIAYQTFLNRAASA